MVTWLRATGLTGRPSINVADFSNVVLDNEISTRFTKDIETMDQRNSEFVFIVEVQEIVNQVGLTWALGNRRGCR